MLKLVSWIDSLPRLTAHRRKNTGQSPGLEQHPKRRQEKIKAKSTTSTPLIKHKNDEKSSWKKQKLKDKGDLRSNGTLNSTIRGAIGRRRYTEADAFVERSTHSPLRALSPASSVLSPRIYLDSPHEENDFMSASWHPDGVERVHSLKMNNSYYQENCRSGNLISSNPVSCSVQEIIFGGDEIHGSSVTLQHSAIRPQIRTNPWVRPKSPRVIPALDLSRSGSLSAKRSVALEQRGQSATLKVAKSGRDEDNERKGSNRGKDDNSVYSLRSSSGYGSGSQDSSPASSVHTPDWQTLSVSRYGSSNLRSASSNGRLSTTTRDSRVSKSREDVALQCDLTEDKSVECNEDDFLPMLRRDENGNIPMIDDEEDSGSDDGEYCQSDDCQYDQRMEVSESDSGSGLADPVPDPDPDRTSDSDQRRASSDFECKSPAHVPDNVQHLDPNQTSSPKPFPRKLQNWSPTSILRKKSATDDLTASKCYDRNSNSDTNTKSKAVLNLLHAKVELLKANSDHVTQAVRTAKEEQRKRNGELRVYEEQMQFLKQLKLAISNGFEVMV